MPTPVIAFIVKTWRDYTTAQITDDDIKFANELMNTGDIEENNESIIMENKPNLMRPNTKSPWDDSDIDEMEDQMRHQLTILQLQDLIQNEINLINDGGINV